MAWFQKVAFGEDFKKLLFLLKNVAMIEFEKKKAKKNWSFLATNNRVQRTSRGRNRLPPQTVVMKKPLRNAQIITYVML
jgi:hypothetical protein